ncbi:MAG: hypothetical protein AB1546_13985 [bacterium]
MLIGLILIGIFLIFAVLMYLGRLPALISLPLMAAALFLTGGAFHFGVRWAYPGSNTVVLLRNFLQVVIEEGTARLAGVIITIILGAVLAELLKGSGISKAIIRWASELGGDNPTVICLLLTFATAVLFTSLGGLGAVIMVATLVLPIMLSIGVSQVTAGGLFLLGLSLGGTFNPVNWQLYIKVLGLTQSQVFAFALPFGGLFAVVCILFAIVHLRKGVSSLWALAEPTEETEKVHPLALLTPVVPIILILSFNIHNLAVKPLSPYYFPINSALLIGIVFGAVTTYRRDGGNIKRLARSIIEGVAASAPAVALVIGIGMVLNAVMHPSVSGFMQPIIEHIMPRNSLIYVIGFSLFAPLALYRGPLNIWGMGSGLVAVMLATGALAPTAIMGALLSVGMIQGVCDPTNTHNAWLAGYLGTDVMVFTRRTLPYMWLLAVSGLIVAGFMFFE